MMKRQCGTSGHDLAKAMVAGTASLLALCTPGRASADSLDVTTATTAPVTTAAASGGSAGAITVESAGSIIVTDTQPAVTINSSNAVTNGGTIGSSAATGATALLIDGTSPITASLTNNGVISITGTDGSGNYGIRLMNGPVSGTISAGSASSISVLGTGAYGVSIESAFTGDITLNSVSVTGASSTAVSLTAPLTGNLRLTGSSSATASGDTGIALVGDISGSVVNAGVITVGSASTTTTNSSGTTVAAPGVGGVAGIAISGNVDGGFVNDLFYTDSSGNLVATASATSSDTETIGTIIGYAGTPAVVIAPSASTPRNISLSAYGTAGTDDGYGFINRGTITSQGNNVGTAATAVEISGTTVDGTLYTTTLAGGLTNQSTGHITAATTAATAIAIDLGAGAIVPTIANAGAIQASDAAGTTALAAFGIRIAAGAELDSITNSGSILAKSAATGIAGYGILDESGTLTAITNSGTITAQALTSGAAARAIDLSAGTTAQTVTNSGTIAGDLLFGSGGGSYISKSGSFSGTLAFSAGTDLLQLSGTTAFANPVTVASGGALAVGLSGTSSLQFSGTAPSLASLALADQSVLILNVSNTASALQVSGAASFTGQSMIKLNIEQPGSRTFTILTAGGGISTDHAASLLGSTSTPYLYTLQSFTVGANDIEVTLHQRTASEAGFVANVAPLYDNALTSMADGGAAFTTIGSLPDQASVLAAFRQIAPPSYGTALARIAEGLQSAGFGAIAARMHGLVSEAPEEIAEGNRLGIWAQQGVEFLHHRDAQDDPGFSSNAYQLNLGLDYRLGREFIIGSAVNFSWTDVNSNGSIGTDGKPLKTNTQLFDLYASWNHGPFYLQAIGSVGHDNYRSRRTITIGSYSAGQSARWSGYRVAGDLIAGARFRFGRFSIEPSDSLTYMRLHQNGYTESGTGVLDLVVDPQRITSTTNTGKLSVNHEWPMFGGALSLSGRGAYVSRLKRDVGALDASFAGGDSFTLISAPLGRSATQEGATIGYHIENFLIAVSSDRRQEVGFSDTSVSAMLRISF